MSELAGATAPVSTGGAVLSSVVPEQPDRATARERLERARQDFKGNFTD
jgi:hypothetical protein